MTINRASHLSFMSFTQIVHLDYYIRYDSNGSNYTHMVFTISARKTTTTVSLIPPHSVECTIISRSTECGGINDA